jgi:perosamine synthetase
MIPLCVPEIAGDEWRNLKACLDGNWVSSAGPQVTAFEDAFAAELGAAHAVAVVNGTSALHIALKVAGVGPGDEVLVSDFTFIAPANAVRYLGAEPVFVDAEPRTWQMDTARAADFLARDCDKTSAGLINRKSGRRVAAVLPVHILGHPVDLSPLLEAAAARGVPVIEDAAESLGARYRGRLVGTFGLAGCFSFNGNKLMTTGGGGMIVTDDPALARRARYLTTQAKEPGEDGRHGEVGYNYRLTSLSAAVGLAQLERLPRLLDAKRRIARVYRAALGDLPGVTTMPEANWAESAYWLYTIRIDAARAGTDARTLSKRLAARGIETRGFWQPMHQSAAQAGAEYLGGETSAALWRELLSLPSSCGLDEMVQARVIAALREELAA